MDNNHIIKFQDVHKSFAGLKVLQGLNLSINQGETLVVMGPSGSGKSVLLKHIIGVLKPDSGNIKVFGEDVPTMNADRLHELRKRIGYVFQLSALFDSMTVGQNVGISLTMHTKLSRSEIGIKISESLDRVGLPEIENRNPEELSGGMKKRVAIARAIASNPSILLYDEPTTGLDPATCQIVNSLIRQLHDNLHVTSVVVTHDIQSATTVADRIVLYNHGQIITEGKPDQMAREGLLQRFINGEKI